VLSSDAVPPVAVSLKQALDLGVTRMLSHRLMRVYPHMCAVKFPKCGTCKMAFRVSNRRFDFMGRRSRASATPPGYVQFDELALLSRLKY